MLQKSYRLLSTVFVMVGAVMQFDFVWLAADTLNVLMAIPNLISLLLSPVVARLTRAYFAVSRSAGAAVPASKARPI